MPSWLSDLVGTDMAPLAYYALVAAIVLALIVIVLAIAKSVMGPGAGPRVKNRGPRLAVLDVSVVDAKRKLVLVRRDEVEHLLLIGGQNDLVVEAGISRAVQQAARAVRTEPSLGGDTDPGPSAPRVPARAVPAAQAPRGPSPLTRPVPRSVPPVAAVEPPAAPIHAETPGIAARAPERTEPTLDEPHTPLPAVAPPVVAPPVTVTAAPVVPVIVPPAVEPVRPAVAPKAEPRSEPAPAPAPVVPPVTVKIESQAAVEPPPPRAPQSVIAAPTVSIDPASGNVAKAPPVPLPVAPEPASTAISAPAPVVAPPATISQATPAPRPSPIPSSDLPRPLPREPQRMPQPPAAAEPSETQQPAAPLPSRFTVGGRFESSQKPVQLPQPAQPRSMATPTLPARAAQAAAELEAKANRPDPVSESDDKKNAVSSSMGAEPSPEEVLARLLAKAKEPVASAPISGRVAASAGERSPTPPRNETAPVAPVAQPQPEAEQPGPALRPPEIDPVPAVGPSATSDDSADRRPLSVRSFASAIQGRQSAESAPPAPPTRRDMDVTVSPAPPRVSTVPTSAPVSTAPAAPAARAPATAWDGEEDDLEDFLSAQLNDQLGEDIWTSKDDAVGSSAPAVQPERPIATPAPVVTPSGKTADDATQASAPAKRQLTLEEEMERLLGDFDLETSDRRGR